MIAALLCAGLLGASRGDAPNYVWESSYVSDQFFSQWDFLSKADPTHGTVQYVGREEAEADGLIRATAESVYMGVDMEAVLTGTGGRRAVRVQSRKTYDEGLFILRVEHVPTGCGLWPAFWMFGEDPSHPWPTLGELDIIEGVHTATRVMTTLHTSDNCRQDGVGMGLGPVVEWAQDQKGNPATNCYVEAPDQWTNQGCPQTGPEASLGAPFNAAGGGTYAAEWDPKAGHIRVWFWRRGTEPDNALDGNPEPNTWGPPYSYFRIDAGTCDPSHFQQMRLVFDTTFCGDLGEPTFAQSCPDKVVQGLRCEDFVRLHPEEMTEAYWSISALDVYVRESSLPARAPGPFTWQNFLAFLGVLGALAVVAAVYTLVWIKVAKDAGQSNRWTALYDHCQQVLTRLVERMPSVPWDRLVPANEGGNRSWMQLAMDEKPNGCAEDGASDPRSSRPPTGSSRIGGGLDGGGNLAIGVQNLQKSPASGRGADASIAKHEASGSSPWSSRGDAWRTRGGDSSGRGGATPT